jgi:SAM-dependent methyltransferase
MRCKICGNKEHNKNFKVKEMMFGYRETFDYIECNSCGCLQISEMPKDMSKYYPSHYYSKKAISPINKAKSFLRNHRTIFDVTGKGIFGAILSKIFLSPIIFNHIRKANINLESKILDVGCASGRVLYILRDAGFKNLLGVDPYIKSDLKYSNGLNILKKFINDIEIKFDLILFNHSFEHIPNPIETLIKVSELLSKDGICLIRTPIASSYAWKKYGSNWVQIDAPRHFFIYTIDSIEILSQKCGLKIKEVIYDSTELQFWGSEQYAKDIPLYSSISYRNNPGKSIFTKREIAYFKKKAQELNDKKLGDQAVFYLISN